MVGNLKAWNADFLKAWNADFRGFNGFSRILSGVLFKIRVINNLRNLRFLSF
ncbi:MAG: hypothetical protein FWG87_00485 [Defluviitaleaceae bacterium]|nr:hypothetical protein [Defluviitaleaceae bacterium]